MDQEDEWVEASVIKCPFDDLPNEIIEFILSFLPPYKDIESCKRVCKRWDNCCQNVIRKTESDLYKAVTNMNVNWRTITPIDMAPSITKRFSHAACIHNNSMYIFGGCTTNSTAFNDLWRFDLSKRQWIRPLAMGTYPTPKAYATMIPYKDYLILFGGWAYPLSIPISQDWMMSSEIHFYNTNLNRWILVHSINNNPPPMAGHSAIIRDDTMIVFGGLYKPSAAPTQSSNDVWVLDLKNMTWTNKSTSSPKPPPRYGQSLIRLNDNHIMILGGIRASKVYSDCWILKMEGEVWTWFEVTVKNKEWSVTDIWCNPACRVGDKVITLSHERIGYAGPMYSIPARILTTERTNENSVTQRLEHNMRRLVDKDSNINGRRGILPHYRPNNVGSSNKNENSVNQKAVEDEPKPGPSSEIKSLNEPTNKSSDVNDNNSTNEPSEDRNEQQLRLPSNIEKNPNENSAQNQSPNNNNRNKNAMGRKFAPGGVKMIKHIRNNYNLRMAAFATDPSVHNVRQNELFQQRRIAHLNERQQEHREPVVINSPPVVPAVKKLRRNTLALHILDISSILNGDCYSSVSWMQPQEEEIDGAPEEVIMYSLVRGTGELIMFGGLFCNVLTHNCMLSNQFSNSLHFIKPPKDII